MTQINPYLRFDGKCKEAMEFYKTCFGGTLNITTVAETPMAKQMPPGSQQRVMHSVLSNGNVTILGSDMLGPEGLVHGSSPTLEIECGSEEEIKTLYSRLSSGGKATYPVSKSFWGGLYGELVDKYGHSWMLNYQKQ